MHVGFGKAQLETAYEYSRAEAGGDFGPTGVSLLSFVPALGTRSVLARRLVPICRLRTKLIPMRMLNPDRKLPEFSRQCALGVMAKAPRVGKVKTRLVPPLLSDEASGLSLCFLQDTLDNLVQIAAASPVLVYTPRGDESAFPNAVLDAFPMLPQRGDDFGARLVAAAEDLLGCGFATCCLIDSDSPTLPRSLLEHAVAALAEPGDRIVLGPTDDGGYYLIGLKHAHQSVFSGIAWSTSAVLGETVQRAEQVGLEVTLLPQWYDVDDRDTLRRLCDELFSRESIFRGYAAPHTRAFLEKLLQVHRESPLWVAPVRSEA